MRIQSLERIFESAFPFPQKEPHLDQGPVPAASSFHPPASTTSSTSFDKTNLCDTRASLETVLAHSPKIRGDPYIDLYYKFFHRYHPCILPQRRLEIFLEADDYHAILKPLVSVMRFIGSLYARSSQGQLPIEATTVDTLREPYARSPFTVQYLLIHSMALYWCGEQVRSREEMDRAIQLALELKMHQQRFATQHGQGDPVLEESWRRTWWQLYIVDLWYAAMKHVHAFPTYDVNPTVDLPCEEKEYEVGVRAALLIASIEIV
jgi:hypothetical protein